VLDYAQFYLRLPRPLVEHGRQHHHRRRHHIRMSITHRYHEIIIIIIIQLAKCGMG
jgi:hypothetical protein